MVARPSPLLARRYTPWPLPRAATATGAPVPLHSVRRRVAGALDPALLSRYAGIEPDDWQARLLRSTARQSLVNCSRQIGKSETTATLATRTAVYTPGAPVLLLSPSQRQSGLLFAKVKRRIRDLGSDFAELDGDSALSLRLANSAEIHSLPGRGETVRGFSGVKLIIVDEAAFIADELLPAISPMLAVSGGRLIMLSSPFGKRGVFWQEWSGCDEAERHGRTPAWERFAITAEQCPRIPADFLAEERRKLGVLFDQEYGCQFLDVVTSLFRHEDIGAALDNDLDPYFADEEVA